MYTTAYRSGFQIALAAVIVTTFESAAVRAADNHQPLNGSTSTTGATVRVASVQTKRRLVDWRITDADEVFSEVDRNLDELERIVRQAARRECDVLAFPEDTLGLLNWYGVNQDLAKEVLPRAVTRMCRRLGRAAAAQQMYLVLRSDNIEEDRATYNTAFFLGRDGREIGRYHKTCPTWSERGARARGTSLPVFPTPDLGNVGMLICYDLVFPETARALALAGADIIIFPTMGGAAVGDGDIGMQALRVRAAENHVYLVVSVTGLPHLAKRQSSGAWELG